MSLEDQLAALVTAIDANTNALQHLASTWRQPQGSPVAAAAAPTAASPAAASTTQEGADAPPPRPRGRPPKNPPPSPAELAASTPASPANAPAAGNGSADSGEPEGTYADLQQLVPQLAESKGRAAAVAVFERLGAKSGPDLQANAPHKIPEAVRLFREALAS